MIEKIYLQNCLDVDLGHSQSFPQFPRLISLFMISIILQVNFSAIFKNSSQRRDFLHLLLCLLSDFLFFSPFILARFVRNLLSLVILISKFHFMTSFSLILFSNVLFLVVVLINLFLQIIFFRFQSMYFSNQNKSLFNVFTLF